MKVIIVDKNTGSVAASISISLNGFNYTPTDDEVILQAWQCALDDGDVKPDLKDSYLFQVVNE